jgi:regulator of sigma E protease
MIESILSHTGDKLFTIAAFVVVLGIIIFVHELGHFLTAKLFGMRVFIFSFGFGKRLFGFRRGDTDYRISLVPLGGYVKLEGEPDDYLSENAAQEGDHLDFLARPRWQRFLVYTAGPAMNVVLTIGLLTGLYMAGIYEENVEQSRPIVGMVVPGDPAEKAGLAPPDEILAIDGKPISHWKELQYGVAISAGRTIRLRVRRGDDVREVDVQPRAEGLDGIGRIGVAPPAYALEVQPGMPASLAGIQLNDGVVRVNGKAIASQTDLDAALATAAGGPVTLSVLRNGRLLDVTVPSGKAGLGLTVGVERVFRRYPPGDAFVAALGQTWVMTQQVADIIRRLVMARVSVRQMAGPLGIARASGRAAREGTWAFLGFIAFVSINVGLLNLFPLTPLDGGHMLVLATEGLIRRDLNLRIKLWISYAGVAAVLLLLVVVFFFDLSKTGLFGQSLR